MKVLTNLNPCMCGKRPTRSYDKHGYHVQCPHEKKKKVKG